MGLDSLGSVRNGISAGLSGPYREAFPRVTVTATPLLCSYPVPSGRLILRAELCGHHQIHSSRVGDREVGLLRAEDGLGLRLGKLATTRKVCIAMHAPAKFPAKAGCRIPKETHEDSMKHGVVLHWQYSASNDIPAKQSYGLAQCPWQLRLSVRQRPVPVSPLA
jgi:hypothetical protein